MLGTANIRNYPDMSPEEVAADTRAVMEHTSVAGLQEIQPGEDTEVVREQLEPHWRMVGQHTEVPIVWDSRKWQLREHAMVAFHRPRLPRPQNRFGAVTSAVFRSVERPHLPPFAVLNTHLVSGGFNGPRVLVIQDRWHTEWQRYQDEAARLWHQGLTVFAVGDLNNPTPPKLRPHQHFTWLTPQKGPDHAGQLQHDASVTIGATYSPHGPVAQLHHHHVPLNSDHDLLTVTGTLDHATV